MSTFEISLFLRHWPDSCVSLRAGPLTLAWLPPAIPAPSKGPCRWFRPLCCPPRGFPPPSPPRTPAESLAMPDRLTWLPTQIILWDGFDHILAPLDLEACLWAARISWWRRVAKFPRGRVCTLSPGTAPTPFFFVVCKRVASDLLGVLAVAHPAAARHRLAI